MDTILDRILEEREGKIYKVYRGTKILMKENILFKYENLSAILFLYRGIKKILSIEKYTLNLKMREVTNDKYTNYFKEYY